MFIGHGLSESSNNLQNNSLPVNGFANLAICVKSRGLHVTLHACNYGKVVVCCDLDTATFGEFK
jgi:hypothetical protein